MYTWKTGWVSASALYTLGGIRRQRPPDLGSTTVEAVTYMHWIVRAKELARLTRKLSSSSGCGWSLQLGEMAQMFVDHLQLATYNGYRSCPPALEAESMGPQ